MDVSETDGANAIMKITKKNNFTITTGVLILSFIIENQYRYCQVVLFNESTTGYNNGRAQTHQHWCHVTFPPSAVSVLSTQMHISICCIMKSLN